LAKTRGIREVAEARSGIVRERFVSGGAQLAGWFVEFEVPFAAVAAFSEALDGVAAAVGSVEIEAERWWRIEAFFREEPDRTRLSEALALVAAGGGWPPPDVSIRPEPVADWVQATYRRFPPFRVGRFYVHGGHARAMAPPASIPLTIEAAVAFGSGEHGSTSGCLLAIDRLRARLERPRVLDLGCGSGILAIAAAKAWRVAVTAADNDPVAVLTARENARINRIGRRLSGWVSAGFGNPRLAGPFDLVLANILARPLMRLARPMAPRLAPGGRVILSGLLAEQERMVFQAYRRHGLAFERRTRRGDWVTLVLKRRAAAGRPAAATRLWRG
jgi:ribosomal protein L11 methyltransferase